MLHIHPQADRLSVSKIDENANVPMNMEEESGNEQQAAAVNALHHEDVFFDAIEEDLDARRVVRDQEVPLMSNDGSYRNMEDVELEADQEATGIFRAVLWTSFGIFFFFCSLPYSGS